MTPASPAHSVESISLVTGVCGHRREQALPINDRPVDLACSDELPLAVDRLYVEGQTAPGDAARRGCSDLDAASHRRRATMFYASVLYHWRNTSPLTGDFWRSRRHARSSIALTATRH
jgi:hypothetical protein